MEGGVDGWVAGEGSLQRAGGQLVGRFQPEEKQEEVDTQERERASPGCSSSPRVPEPQDLLGEEDREPVQLGMDRCAGETPAGVFVQEAEPNGSSEEAEI